MNDYVGLDFRICQDLSPLCTVIWSTAWSGGGWYFVIEFLVASSWEELRYIWKCDFNVLITNDQNNYNGNKCQVQMSARMMVFLKPYFTKIRNELRGTSLFPTKKLTINRWWPCYIAMAYSKTVVTGVLLNIIHGFHVIISWFKFYKSDLIMNS